LIYNTLEKEKIEGITKKDWTNRHLRFLAVPGSNFLIYE